ncbi:SDR family oxidoreductase [Crossiella sp. CA198]|uniref:SDR family oxidoreductase n=1 Tax=Crossiella sp. CA198 TaxID=3455607 RepID=UPI003F8D88E1
MSVVLVTGGSGTLGRAVVRGLVREGHRVRLTSRSPRPAEPDPGVDWHTVDYATGQGLDAAFAGVDSIVHTATVVNGKRDAALTRTVVEAAVRAGAPHLVYISIVGVDRIPFSYYRGKLAAEAVVRESGLPWTILRTTQFHDLVLRVLSGLAVLPIMPVPSGIRVQSVEVTEVAERLVALATGTPAGNVPDLGGPETHLVSDLARLYLRARGKRRRLLPVRFPGKVFTTYRNGEHLAPEHAHGTVTFAEFLAEETGKSQ